MADPKLFWLDLETTGLLPDVPYAQILEIAVAEAELSNPFELNHIYHAVLKPRDRERTWAYMDPIVREMHMKSGLWEECLESKIPAGGPGRLADLIPAAPMASLLAGSTVHFDRAWMTFYMGSEFVSRFHYRHYDVSAVKLFCQSLGMEKIPKGEAHRAKADIEESAAHGKLCAEWLSDHYVHPSHTRETVSALRDIE